MNPTHKVIITVSSEGDEPGINMSVQWDPLLTDEQVEELGFVPTAYRVAERMVLAVEPMIDPDSVQEFEEEDLGFNRTLN